MARPPKSVLPSGVHSFVVKNDSLSAMFNCRACAISKCQHAEKDLKSLKRVSAMTTYSTHAPILSDAGGKDPLRALF
jgi:hypothetical protein